MNKSFNTFRILAFLAIFLFHTDFVDFGFGYLGVLAFFVLSGYLITPILLKTKKNTTTFKAYIKNFYGRRALRILPPYYLYLLIATAIILIAGVQNTGDYAIFMHQLPFALSYTYDFYHTLRSFQHSELVTHFWSLAVEEQFYIFWPFAIYFVAEKHLKKTLLLLIFAGPFIRLITGLVVEYHLFRFLSDAKEIVIYVSPFSHVDAFLIGGFCSVFLKNYVPNTLTIILSTAAVLIIGLSTSQIATNHIQFHSLGYLPFMKDSYKYIWGYSLMASYFGLILMRLSKRDFIKPFFENGVMNYLGKISYGLYIYHYPALYLVTNYFHFEKITYIIIATLSITIIASILSYELFEKMVLKLKDKFFPAFS